MIAVKLSRLLAAACVALALFLPRPAGAGDFNPAIGNYLNPDSVGWGLDIQRIGDFIFVLWFTYLPDGTPVWYLAAAELDGMTFTADIDKFTWDGETATPTTVGTMTLVWSDEENATFSWTLNGVSGELPVAFLTFAEGLTDVDHTGHYVAPLQTGWGASILTQGLVSAMFLYFYDQFGEPVWLLGTSVTPGMQQRFPLVYFNGPGLCPSCIARKTAVDEPTVVVTLEVKFVRVEENFLDEISVDYRSVGIQGGFNWTPGTVDPVTPLGSDPLGNVDIPQDGGIPGLGPFQTLVPLTPRPSRFMFPEMEFFMRRTKVSFDPAVFSVQCQDNRTAHVEIPEPGPTGFPVVEDQSGDVFNFFLPGPGEAPSRVGVSKVGDTALSINWQALFSDGTIEGLNLIARIQPGSTIAMLDVNEVSRTQSIPFLTGIPILGMLFKREVVFAENSELSVFICARVTDVVQGR